MIAASVTECNVPVAMPSSRRTSSNRPRACKRNIAECLLHSASRYRRHCCDHCRIHVIAVIPSISARSPPLLTRTLRRRRVKPFHGRIDALFPSIPSSI